MWNCCDAEIPFHLIILVDSRVFICVGYSKVTDAKDRKAWVPSLMSSSALCHPSNYHKTHIVQLQKSHCRKIGFRCVGAHKNPTDSGNDKTSSEGAKPAAQLYPFLFFSFSLTSLGFQSPISVWTFTWMLACPSAWLSASSQHYNVNVLSLSCPSKQACGGNGSAPLAWLLSRGSHVLLGKEEGRASTSLGMIIDAFWQ